MQLLKKKNHILKKDSVTGRMLLMYQEKKNREKVMLV